MLSQVLRIISIFGQCVVIPRASPSLQNLGLMEDKLGNAQEALKRTEKALVQARKIYGEEHPVLELQIISKENTPKL